MRQGFTLIELTIVLVIIGLIVGGVLVGKDLVSTSELRAQVSQMEKLEATIATFRGKFNALPGDMPNTANFGLQTCGGPFFTSFRGNGDGRLQYDTGGTAYAEDRLFFCNLFNANLWPYTSITPTQGVYIASGIGVPSATSKRLLVALGRVDAGWAAGNANLQGYQFFVTGINPPYDVWFAYKPIEMLYIDTKMDDGLPATGKVMATRDNAYPYTSGAAGSANCVDSGTTPNTYNTTYSATDVCVPAFKIGGYQ